MSMQPEPQYLAAGRILRPHGVRGELRVEVLTDYPEHFVALKVLYLGSQRQVHQVVSARIHKQHVLLKLQGCDDRDAADALRGSVVYVAISDAIPLEEAEYYEYQLEGLDVVTDEGEPLGELVEVLSVPGANDVFVVHGPQGEILIPAIEDVVLDIDLDAGRMVIRLLPGLLGAS